MPRQVSDQLRVLVTDYLHSDAVAWLEERGVVVAFLPADRRADLAEFAQQADALIIRTVTRVTRALLEAAPRVRVVGRAGSGLDNIDVDAARGLDVVVLNAPDANSISAAEHTFALLLAVARDVVSGDERLKQEAWAVEGGRERPLGTELNGLTMGVVGFGRIGQRVSALAKCFSMQVLINDPVIDDHKVDEIGVEVVERLADLLPRVDVLTVHTPLDCTTRGLIGRRELELLPVGSIVINCARGGIVDEVALLQALNEGRLRGAGLDVFEQEPPVSFDLASHPKVVATPHWGARTSQAKRRVGLEIASRVYQALTATS